MSQGTLVLIDTDSAFENLFRRRLNEQSIADQYALVRITPDTSLDERELVEACVSDACGFPDPQKILAFLVDIVVLEKRELDTIGISIAKALRQRFPETPLFTITGKDMHEDELDILSEATLEDVDGVLVKSYLDGKMFSAKRLRLLLEKAGRNRRRVLATLPAAAGPPRAGDARAPHPSAEDVPPEILAAFSAASVDWRVRAQIRDVGWVRFWKLLSQLLPNAEGTLSYVRPGRSGAQVFRILAKFREGDTSPTRAKTWLVKVGDDASKLLKEAQNHSALTRTPADRRCYPRLLREQPLSCDNLHGLVYEFEGQVHTLLDHFVQRASVPALGDIARKIGQFLATIYGDPVRAAKHVWHAYYALGQDASAAIRTFLSEHRPVLTKQVGEDSVNRVDDFAGHDVERLAHINLEVDTRHVHGDLNSGNVLVTNDGELAFIDFASRHQSHVARDFTKLERDLVFKVVDAQTALFYDWASIPHWERFLCLLDRRTLFAPTADQEAAAAEIGDPAKLILALRAELRRISPTIQEDEYLCGLLHYSMLALAHPEVSLHKKTFGIRYIGAILDQLAAHQ